MFVIPSFATSFPPPSPRNERELKLINACSQMEGRAHRWLGRMGIHNKLVFLSLCNPLCNPLCRGLLLNEAVPTLRIDGAADDVMMADTLWSIYGRSMDELQAAFGTIAWRRESQLRFNPWRAERQGYILSCALPWPAQVVQHSSSSPAFCCLMLNQIEGRLRR